MGFLGEGYFCLLEFFWRCRKQNRGEELKTKEKATKHEEIKGRKNLWVGRGPRDKLGLLKHCSLSKGNAFCLFVKRYLIHISSVQKFFFNLFFQKYVLQINHPSNNRICDF